MGLNGSGGGYKGWGLGGGSDTVLKHIKALQHTWLLSSGLKAHSSRAFNTTSGPETSPRVEHESHLRAYHPQHQGGDKRLPVVDGCVLHAGWEPAPPETAER
ncbi:unnamed protein product [Arctogadus glacialis]